VTTPGGIIWLASFPKSGNTWFRILLANLAAGENGPADINDLDERGGIASGRHAFEAATLLDSGLISPDDIDRLRPGVYAQMAAEAGEARWIKVHDAYTVNADGKPVLGRGVARAVVYLVRDPRDVAISLAFHNSTTIDAAIELINAPDGALCRGRKGLPPQLRQKLAGWSGHAASWLDQTDTPVCLLRYEDLCTDPGAAFSRALALAERPAAPEEIERAVRHAAFGELRRQESEKGFGERMSRTAPFFRSGEAGAWRRELTPDQVARIEAVHAPMMDRLGYAVAGADTCSERRCG